MATKIRFLGVAAFEITSRNGVVASVPMKQQKSGNIINVSSVAGLQVGNNGRGADYAAAKAGVSHYTRLLAAELGPYGIRVNCIAPGYITSSKVISQAQATEEMAKEFPLGRLGRPEDCANVIEFLVSDLSGYITGQCITIDGGFTLTHVWPAKSDFSIPAGQRYDLE